VKLKLVPKKQHKQSPKYGNDNPCGMKLRASLRAGKDVRHQPANNRTDATEHDRPDKRQVHVHDHFRNDAGNQTNNYVPNEMKHVTSFE
jgi:hypothetical protein